MQQLIINNSLLNEFVSKILCCKFKRLKNITVYFSMAFSMAVYSIDALLSCLPGRTKR